MWIGTSGGNWTDAAQWSNSAPPASGDDVFINPTIAGNQTITFDSGAGLTYSSLTIDAAGGGTNLFSMSANALTVSGNLVVGNSGVGIFTHTGGNSTLTGTGGLYLGYNAGSTGFYSLGATGSLSANTHAGSQYIGYGGLGNFNQSGGTNSLGTLNFLYLGYSTGATGNYTLTGGVLNSPILYGEFIGYGGAANFNQSGGVHAMTSSYFEIGTNASSTGSYTLSGGTLNAVKSWEYVGYDGLGYFNHTGGTNSITAGGQLVVGTGYTTGYYTLTTGAALYADNSTEFVANSGGGYFNQSGGINSLTGNARIQIGSNGSATGTYNLSGGTFSASNSTEVVGSNGVGYLNNSGGVNLLGAGSTLTVGYFLGTGTYNLQTGGTLNAANAIEDIGYAEAIGNINQSGGSHSLGSFSTMNLGHFSGSTGFYTLGSNAVLNVSLSSENIGFSGVGVFSQAGGIHSMVSSSYLVLGANSGSTGSYILSTGANLLATNSYEYIGYSGAGDFNQTGGANSLSNFSILALGFAAGSTGTYTLSNGILHATNSFEYLGYNGTGSFNQSGGLHALMGNSPMHIGESAGVRGTYTLGNDAVLTAVNSNEYVAYSGIGTFNQSGGTNMMAAGSYLTVGAGNGAIGAYFLSGGLLSVVNNSEMIGDAGYGVLMQSGGANAVRALYLGNSATASGSYALSGGFLTSSGGEYIGVRGTADFNQTGGTNNFGAGNLYLSTNSGSTASYTLSGGLLTGSNVYISGTPAVAGGNAKFFIAQNGQMTLVGNLLIGNQGLMTLTGPVASSSFSSVGGLQIAPAGRLSINNKQNVFKINYGTDASPNSTIRNYLQNGYNNGHWNSGSVAPFPSFGAIISATAGASSNHFSLGYADGADGVAVNPTNSQLLLPAGQEEIKYTYAGDANLDGQVNLSDLIILANHFGSAGAQWDEGDYSYDGSVNLTDLVLLAGNFGSGVGNPAQEAMVHSQFQQDLTQLEEGNPSFASALGAAVPEPGGLALLSIGALGILRRRIRLH